MEKVNMCEQMGNFNRDGNIETTGNARNEKCSMRRNFWQFISQAGYVLIRRKYPAEERIREVQVRSKEINWIEIQREKKWKEMEQSLKKSLEHYQTT